MNLQDSGSVLYALGQYTTSQPFSPYSLSHRNTVVLCFVLFWARSVWGNPYLTLLRGPYGMRWTEPQSASCKAVTLSTVLLLWPQHSGLYSQDVPRRIKTWWSLPLFLSVQGMASHSDQLYAGRHEELLLFCSGAKCDSHSKWDLSNWDPSHVLISFLLLLPWAWWGNKLFSVLALFWVTWWTKGIRVQRLDLLSTQTLCHV